MVTQVVNIHNGDTFDVYCGHAGHGFDGYFGNPCKKEGVPREIACAEYEKYFYKRIAEDAEFKAKVLALKGLILSCFCMPKQCHVMTIVNYLEGIDANQQRANYTEWKLRQIKPLVPKKKEEAPVLLKNPELEDMFPE